jgi:hypothetical protein
MGGPGSGSWYRSGKKDKVEDLCEIDVRRWHREGFFRARPRYVSWKWCRDGKQIAAIGVRTSHGGAELSYSCWRGGDKDDKRSVDYTVPITWTACNYGGERPWFVCPGGVNVYACHRRVAKLYLSGEYFLCRHCQDLTYETRQLGRKDSALRKCQKIRRRLGGSANMIEPFPPRPKGMHLKTYMRLWREHDKAEQQYTEIMLASLKKMKSQLSTTGGDGEG